MRNKQIVIEIVGFHELLDAETAGTTEAAARLVARLARRARPAAPPRPDRDDEETLPDAA
ncbi:MAG: hypothetical protein R6V85_10680 [Polyangia bacterium]